MEKLVPTRKAEQAKPCANFAVIDSIIVNEVKKAKVGVDLVSGSVAGGRNETMSAYLVKVRMDDGTYHVVSQQDQPGFRVGEKVKIVDDKIVRLEGTAMMDKSHIIALMLAALASRVF